MGIPRKTIPTPYPELNTVLHELVDSMKAVLGHNLLAAYLQGSFAVGDFDQHSDVDWIVCIDEELTGEQAQALTAMHERIYHLDCPWAQHLEGSYFPREVLRDYTRRGEPLWYLDHGAQTLIRSDHCNTILVRWVVREFGVVLAGPEPISLVDPIPVAALRREILTTMNGWGRQIVADPEEINNRFYQAFAVLNYCRMVHDLYRGYPGSKRAGAEWAKAVLAPTWAGLIDRAWAGRPDPARSVRQPADPEELQKTVAFIKYMLSEGDRLFALQMGDRNDATGITT